MKETYWRYSLVLFILVLGFVLFRQAMPFMNGVLGAFTLYIVLRSFTYKLQKKMKPTLAVWLVTIGSALFILIPMTLFTWVIVEELLSLQLNPKAIITPLVQAVQAIKEKTDFDLLSEKNISYLVSWIPSIGQSVMSGVSNLVVNLFVAVMLLFFMLSKGRAMENYVSSLLPFTEDNKREVLKNIQLMVRSNAIGIPLLALIQGFIAFGGYLLCQVPNAFLAAFLTAFASIIPIVGTTLIWVPVSAYFLLMGDWVHGLALFAYGAIVIAQCDNLIRFILQKKMADTHPLITIFGVVAGIPLFGFMGVIFGPLLVSLFLLFVDMFRKDIIKKEG